MEVDFELWDRMRTDGAIHHLPDEQDLRTSRGELGPQSLGRGPLVIRIVDVSVIRRWVHHADEP